MTRELHQGLTYDSDAGVITFTTNQGTTPDGRPVDCEFQVFETPYGIAVEINRPGEIPVLRVNFDCYQNQLNLEVYKTDPNESFEEREVNTYSVEPTQTIQLAQDWLNYGPKIAKD